MSDPTIHDLIADVLPKNGNPWDWRMFSPSGLDDEPVLTVLIKWESTEPWIEHRFSISLTKIPDRNDHPPQ